MLPFQLPIRVKNIIVLFSARALKNCCYRINLLPSYFQVFLLISCRFSIENILILVGTRIVIRFMTSGFQKYTTRIFIFFYVWCKVL